MNDFLRLLELPVLAEELEKFAYAPAKFSIRELREEDAPQLAEIEKASFPNDPYPEEVFKHWHIKGAGVVADVGGAPCGYLLHREDSDKPEFRYGQSLAVHPGHRKEGMAEALMCNLLEKYANVSADVDTKNEASKGLLKKLGFKAVRTFKEGDKRSHRMHHTSQAKEAADVYIIRGNKDVIGDDVGSYDTFYDSIKKHVEGLGYKAEFDNGEPNTTPPGGKFWLGHSRGKDRLRFAPKGVGTLRLDDYEPQEVRDAETALYDKLFKQFGVDNVAGVPVAFRPKPTAAHYTFNPEMQNAVTELLKAKGTQLSKSAFENYEPFLQLVKRAEDDDSHPFTVAVDLDGTLAEKEEPFSADSIGMPIEEAVEWVKKFKKAGARIIIFTVRGDNELTKDWLDEHEIPYDFINENPDQPKGSSGKVFADVYWDDKAYNAENPEEHGPTILQKITASKDTEDSKGFSVSIMKQTIITISAPMLLEALQPEEDK